MKKGILAVSLFATLSAFAGTGGTEAPWSQHTNIVEFNCTGTVLGGQWVITAQHCTGNNVSMNNNRTITVVDKVNHPDYLVNDTDVSLWKVGYQSTQHVTFLSAAEVSAGEKVTGFGFGGTKSLSYITQETLPVIDYIPHILDTRLTGNGSSVAGDSGMPWVDKNNLIVAVHGGGSPIEGGARAVRISSIATWITDNVNAWHFATRAETSSSLTIDVQSLHRSDVLDQSYSSGDVAIVGGTCRGATIKPFEICSLQITSSGYQGVIHLSATETIVVNEGKIKPNTPPPAENNAESGSGGSVGYAFLSMLVLMALRRRAQG